MFVETALCDTGFRAVAVNGGEVSDLLQDSRIVVYGLLTDVDLGNSPGGWQVTRRACEVVSALPVIYVSGACAREFTSRGVPGSRIIDRPFTPSQIVAAVSSLLDPAHDKT